MVAESVAILVICLLWVWAARMARPRRMVTVVLPVAVLPMVYLVITGLLKWTADSVLGIRSPILLAFGMVFALCVTCGVTVLIGHRMQSKKIKRIYVSLILVYSILLGWAYIYDILSPLLV